MLKINYSLIGNDVPKSSVEKKGIELVCYIEGHITICLGSQVFFDEPTPLLELGAHLYRWLYLRDAASDFTYTSMEHEEPILWFTHVTEERWAIDSIWRKIDAFEVEWKELKTVIAGFLTQLDVDLQEQYGLRIISFTDARLP